MNLVTVSSAVFLVFIGSLYVIYARRPEVNKFSPEKSFALFTTDKIDSPDTALALFPRTSDFVEKFAACAIKKADQLVTTIVQTDLSDNNQMTIEAVARPYDMALHALEATAEMCEVVSALSPDESVRKAALVQMQKLKHYAASALERSNELYKRFEKLEAQLTADTKSAADDRMFVQKVVQTMRVAGAHLSAEKRAELDRLTDEIGKKGAAFDAAVANDQRVAVVDEKDLAGVDERFIASCERDADGKIILRCDYPTSSAVMPHCHTRAVRKQFAAQMSNRGYPENKKRLEAICALRKQVAQILGHPSYASLSLANRMIGSEEAAQEFIATVIDKSSAGAQKHLELLRTDLPEGVLLSDSGKLYDYDHAYVSHAYIKKHFALDQRKVAEYFPLEKTIAGIFAIYQKFLGVRFSQEKVSNAWVDDVRMLSVYDGDDTLLGYIVLDMHPRPNKYSHACQATAIPSLITQDGSKNVAVMYVICNFTRPTDGEPSLLLHNEVSTFFHEFGHAMHGILGRQRYFALSGTQVQLDFVELPSQILEEWVLDPDMLTMISGHYQTGEPLPREYADTLRALRKFDGPSWVQVQAFLSAIALDCHGEAPLDDFAAFWFAHRQRIYQVTATSTDNHRYASFQHLINYEAGYYGYLWSKYLALDLFSEIKKQGLLNSEIGKKFVAHILAPGGSRDPHEMVKEFLGREPRMDAFLEELGL